MDLKIDTATGDLAIENGDLVLLDGPDAIAQHLSTRLRFWKGDWYLDTRIGIPYLEQILIKAPNENVVRAIFRKAILDTPGVEALRSLLFSYDGAIRRLTIEFDADIVGADEPVSFVEEMII